MRRKIKTLDRVRRCRRGELRLSARSIVTISYDQFQFSIPLRGGTQTLPAYRTSLPGSIDYVPSDVPAGNPLAPCTIIPN